MIETDRFSLSELNNLVGNTLKEHLDGFFWVVAEINNLNENRSGHCYLELIEKSADGDHIIASAKAIMWAAKYRFIRAYFEQTTGESLKAGIKIMAKVSIEYHSVYGLSFIISDIDAAYTLGEAALKRQSTIQSLMEAGVFDMNKSLPLPAVIKRIAVISSRGAAGYEDFVNQLENNPYGYKFQLAPFEASMQGSDTEKTVVEAMNAIFYGKKNFDTVVIIRGGGSKADLAAFDNYNIAYYITQFPIPILTGIGHERDESVADLVANTRLKTPTAVAEFIIDRNQSYEQIVNSVYENIIERSQAIIRDHFSLIHYFSLDLIQRAKTISNKHKQKHFILFQRLSNSSNRILMEKKLDMNTQTIALKSNSGYAISRSYDKIQTDSRELSRSWQHHLLLMNEKINHFSKTIEIANPENILKHGFSITRIGGKALTSCKEIHAGQAISTQLFDGIITSIVENCDENTSK
ncbi:MAG TPA: exodeoxyribonuclease VII large subunit [Bacteroidales bacterium]|nr:exodeoxyribonuclease VII large subunit [Bacteroidales bacterium]HQP03290.1 exodeoxyribonuclease VII large subunit [Bacteroidales bacterium]